MLISGQLINIVLKNIVHLKQNTALYRYKSSWSAKVIFRCWKPKLYLQILELKISLINCLELEIVSTTVLNSKSPIAKRNQLNLRHLNTLPSSQDKRNTLRSTVLVSESHCIKLQVRSKKLQILSPWDHVIFLKWRFGNVWQNYCRTDGASQVSSRTWKRHRDAKFSTRKQKEYKYSCNKGTSMHITYSTTTHSQGNTALKMDGTSSKSSFWVPKTQWFLQTLPPLALNYCPGFGHICSVLFVFVTYTSSVRSWCLER